MNRNSLVALIVIILAVGAFLVFANRDNGATEGEQTINPPATTTPEPTPQPTPNPTTPPPAATQPVFVNITSSGFQPASITVKKGTSVTFVNDDTKPRWPASAPHPSHTDYPQFDPKQAIPPTDSWEFTFDKVGTWRYHDHLNPTQFGSVTVTE